MSLLLISTLSRDASGPSSLRLPRRQQKSSIACLACKLRKTKCTGGQLCNACNERSSDCSYDAAADQRRKIANRQNFEDLKEARSKPESHRSLLDGIIAIIRAGDIQQINDLIHVIKTGVDLSQIAAHARNGLRSSISLTQAYNAITRERDGPFGLHLPAQSVPSSPTLQSNSATYQYSEPLTTLQQGQDTKAPDESIDHIFASYLEAMQELRGGLNQGKNRI